MRNGEFIEVLRRTAAVQKLTSTGSGLGSMSMDDDDDESVGKVQCHWFWPANHAWDAFAHQAHAELHDK